MRLTVIGCSPAWPNPGEAQSGYLVEGPGRLLLDCGAGVLSRLRGLDGGWPAIDAIVLGHLHHGTSACGLRVADGRSTLAYSGDSGPGEALAELARAADLFLCEATLAEDAVDSPPRGHMTASEAQDAFAASGARRLVLTHRPAELPAPDGVEVARGGLAIDL